MLLEINKDSKIYFHSAILPFNLTVSLQIKGGQETLLDAKEIAEQ